MAYVKEDLINKSIEAITKYNLFFIEDVVAYLPCDKTTFYRKKCHECNDIKEALEANKIKTKASMRKKWYESPSSSLQIALYKIIGSEEEAHRLNGSRREIDHTTGGQPFSEIKVKIIGGESSPVTSEDEIDADI